MTLEMSNKTFKAANTLIRQGSIEEAVKILRIMIKENQKCTAYHFALAYCNQMTALKTLQSPKKARKENHNTFSALHPGTDEFHKGLAPTIVVATTVLNGDQYLKQCIESILNQSGYFTIDYRIKDAGSTDKTDMIAKEFLDLVATGHHPLSCIGISMTYTIKEDVNMYQGLNQAFLMQSSFQTESFTIQTYLNADDFIHQRTISTICEKMSNSKAKWITGQPRIVDNNSRLIKQIEGQAFDRERIRDGFYDGENEMTIQQEGTFWDKECFDNVGGFSEEYDLAGDFDFWVKLARRYSIETLNCSLASFRSHSQSLSSKKMSIYKREIELIKARMKQGDQELSGAP